MIEGEGAQRRIEDGLAPANDRERMIESEDAERGIEDGESKTNDCTMRDKAPMHSDFLYDVQLTPRARWEKTISTMTQVLFVFEDTGASVQLVHQGTKDQYLVTTLVSEESKRRIEDGDSKTNDQERMIGSEGARRMVKD